MIGTNMGEEVETTNLLIKKPASSGSGLFVFTFQQSIMEFEEIPQSLIHKRPGDPEHIRQLTE